MGNSAGKFDYETALKNDITLQPTKHFKSFESLGYQDVKTLWELVNAVYKKFPELRFLGRRRIDDDGNLREFVWITYKQGIQTINFLSSGITSLISELGPSEDSDLKTKSNHPDSEQEDDQYMKNFFAYCEDANENIGIYSKNRPEWMLTAIGVHSIKQKAVPLYDTFGQESICFIIGQANLRVVFCSADKVEKLIQAKESGDAASLKIIVQFDYDPKYNNKADMVQTEMVEKSKTAGLRLLGFQQLLRIGEENSHSFDPERPTEDSLAYIMYTSGTSGRPKGVMLTNQNAVSTLRNCIGSFQSTENCALLSYLPLAHIFETTIEFLCILTGGHVGYFSGDIKLIASDLVELRPHYFVGVPRVFDKMYSRVMASVADASFVKRWLFHFALKRGIDQTHCAASLTRPKSLDALVWSKLRQKLGFDRVKHLVTGGAPCPTHLIEFLRVMTAGEVLQGYGLTETFAVVSLTNGDDPNLGQMGLPLNCEIKLESVADTDYDPNGAEARGELTLRGECLFKGYFRDEARTREAVRDGWFYTGDVCRLNPNNTISVIDRIKAIFKLSQGEYVSPEVVEIAYGRSGAVNQIYIYGDSTKPFLVAVIVPDVNWALELLSDIQETKTAKSQLSSNSITEFVETFEKLCSENDLKLNSEMQKTLTNFEENLSGFEKIRKVHLEYKIDNQFNGFSPENGLLTPSFKLRRTFLSKRYKKILDSLYEKMGI